MPRRRYIDWARGLAVLIMIEAHTFDAWTRAASRSTVAFQNLMVLGGFAAPLFLWLAGLSVVLAAERTCARTGSRRKAVEASVARGAEIFILAFLFRLQAFVVSPGSWPVTIFRVDILNIMGPAMAAAGLVWGLSRGPRRAALGCAVAATAIAMATPLVRTAAWVDTLPMWAQWYVRPFGDHTTFTLFPWSGFVLAGACCGTLVAKSTSPGAERRLVGSFAVAGAALLWLGFYTASQPSIYTASSFWTSSPTFFAIRVGVMLLALAALFLLSARVSASARSLVWLETIGRNSLFIYWIHIELVYGYATWALHGRLPVWGAGVAFGVFVVLLYRAIFLRDRVVAWWGTRRGAPAGAGAGPA